MFTPTREELETLRDELKVRIHLGGKDLQEAWENLESRWKRFEAQAAVGKTASNVGAGAQLLATELMDGYERIKKAL